MQYIRTDPIFEKSRKTLVLIFIFFMIISVFQFPTTGIKFMEGSTFYGTSEPNPGNLSAIGDLDNDGFTDILLTQPMSSQYTMEGGAAFLFFGKEGGFDELRPSNADVIFHGDAGTMLGSSFAVWDSEGTGWSELVFGCPGDDDGKGTALVFDSVLVDGSPGGTILGPTSAQTTLHGTDTYGFGKWMETGLFTDSGTHELVIMSMENTTLLSRAHLFTGDGTLEDVEEADLPSLSVNDDTMTTSLDLMGRGYDALVYSSPSRAQVRIVYLDVQTSLVTEIKLMTGTSGIGSTLFAGDVNEDAKDDLIISNARNSRVRVFFGNESHWDNIPGINSDMDNVTIVGEGGSGFGTSMDIVGTSPFTPSDAILISQPYLSTDIGSGAVVSFDLPLDSEYMAPSSDGFVLHSTNGTRFGTCVVSIGDTDADDYPEFVVGSLDEIRRLLLLTFDRSANEPGLSLDSPSRENPLRGTVEIKATVDDPDGDASPWDIRFYWSIDNRSWGPVGNGTPDSVQGSQAIKIWNTSNDQNRLYFLKVEVTDGFGLTTARYSNSVEVLNHQKPSVLLIYPIGGTTLKGSEEITARVILADKEELQPPVTFHISRDGETWEEIGNASAPNSGSEVDFTYLLDTTTLDDGAIYIKANATTVYGLGREAANGVPCHIDNAYVPEVEFTGNYSGTIRGILNITAMITDTDGDIDPPIEIFLRDPSVVPWDFLGNMTGPIGNDTYYYELDTTTLGNGEYEFRITVEDLTFNQEEAILNTTVIIHNLYTPTIEFKEINGSSVFSGIPRIRASIWDRDGNYNSSGVAFYYKASAFEVWNRIPQSLINSGVATVDWDTMEIVNGRYDLLVEIIDEDGLKGTNLIEGVTVKNVKPPTVVGDLPSSDGKLSGRITVRFNITDDDEIPMGDIRVEVFVLSAWVEIKGVERTNPDLVFVPDSPVSYQIIWNTAAVDENGTRLYPDAPGYEMRITILDPDGESDSWTSPISFRVDNGGGISSDDDDDDDDAGSSINSGIIAIIIFVAIIIIVILIIVLIMWFGRKSEKQGSMPVVATTKKEKKKKKPKVVVDEEEKEEEAKEDLYSPGGWGGDSSSMYETGPQVREEPAYQPEPAPASPPPDDLFSDIFAVGGSPRKASTPPGSAPGDLDDLEVEIDLPDEAMPSVEEDEEEEWGDAEEWGDDEDGDWEELDDVEEEEWGDDDDEDEWEDEDDEEEEEEEIFVIGCRCGEEIEIPESRKNKRFKCPSCGRTGKLRG